jgi:ABC-type branched-subunit amino acid transport system ATPase component
MSALVVKHLKKAFGGTRAVDDISLTVQPGQIVGLLGPNGSGKTTLVNCVSGALRPDEGQVELLGRPVTGLNPETLSERGLVRTFQTLNIFPEISCLGNVLLAQRKTGENIFSTITGRSSRAVTERAYECLVHVGMEKFAYRLAGGLSYGQQRLIEFAATFMRNPSVVILDEPTAGVNPAMIEALLPRIKELARVGAGILLIEHNMKVASYLCDTSYVMNFGAVIFKGSMEELRNDPKVIDAYFGR